MEGKKIRWWDGLHAMWTLLYYRLAPLAQFAVAPDPRSDAGDRAPDRIQTRAAAK
jgi:hypothetical protein